MYEVVLGVCVDGLNLQKYIVIILLWAYSK